MSRRVFVLEKKFRKLPNGAGQRPSLCHPNRPNKGGGHCENCYNRLRYAQDAAFRDSVSTRGKASYGRHRTKRLASQKEFRKLNPTKGREKKLLERYGIGLIEFERLRSEQNGLCAVCHEQLRNRIYVDHRRGTRMPRGLVHPRCNLVVGFIESHPHVIFQAVGYLAQRRSV